VEEVRSALSKLPGIKGLALQLSPPFAQFKIDTAKTSMQDIVVAIRSAGAQFDGKLDVAETPNLPDSTLDKLDAALTAVKGIKNTGYPDEHGDRVLTFDLKQKTMLADILRAAKSVGIELATPKTK